MPHSGIDAVPTVDFTFPENTILPGQSVLTLSDAELDSMDLNASNAWIHFVYPEPLGNGTFRKVNQLFDAHGNMVDEVVFHYLSEAWPPFSIFDSILYNSRVIYSRTGLKNNFNKSDWISGVDSFGEINPSLQLPWRNEDRWIPLEPGSVVLENGTWSGALKVPEETSAGPIFLYVNNGDGVVGTASEIYINELPELSWRLPEDFEHASENNAGLVYFSEIILPEVTESNLDISIANLGVGEFEFPASVTIPAGDLSVFVPFTVLDDDRVDGLTRVFLEASARGFKKKKLELWTEDNEVGGLVLYNNNKIYFDGDTIIYDFDIGEGEQLVRGFGLVATSQPVVNDLVVFLEADGVMETPETVVIPAGSQSVWFDVYMGEDSIPNDYPFIHTLKANVPGWPEALKEIPVKNNDPHPQTFISHSLIKEGSPLMFKTGLVSPLPYDITYQLSYGFERQVILPDTVLLAAGSTEAEFEVFVPDNGIIDEPSQFRLRVENPNTSAYAWIEVVDSSAPSQSSIQFPRLPTTMLNSEVLHIEADVYDPLNELGEQPILVNVDLLADLDKLELISPNDELVEVDGKVIANATFNGAALDARLRFTTPGATGVTTPINVLDGWGLNYAIIDSYWNFQNNRLVVFSMYDTEMREYDPETGEITRTLNLPHQVSFIQRDASGQKVWVGFNRKINPVDDSIEGSAVMGVINMETFEVESLYNFDIGNRNAVREIQPLRHLQNHVLIYADFDRFDNPALLLVELDSGVILETGLDREFANAELIATGIDGEFILHGAWQVGKVFTDIDSIEIDSGSVKELNRIEEHHFQSNLTLLWVEDKWLRQNGDWLDPETFETTGKILDTPIEFIAKDRNEENLIIFTEALEILHYNIASQEVLLTYKAPWLFHRSEPGLDENKFHPDYSGIALRTWGDRGILIHENFNWPRETAQNFVFFKSPTHTDSSTINGEPDASPASAAKGLRAFSETASNVSGPFKEAEQTSGSLVLNDASLANSSLQQNSLSSAERVIIVNNFSATESELATNGIGIALMASHPFEEDSGLFVRLLPGDASLDDLNSRSVFKFAAGSTFWQRSSSVNQSIVKDDLLPELDEKLILEFLDPTLDNEPRQVVITILNDDFPELRGTDGLVTRPVEGLIQTELEYQLDPGAIPYPLDIRYETVPGTAKPGVDYLHREGVLSIEAGESNGTLSVPVLAADGVAESKSFSIRILNPGGTLLQETRTEVVILPHATGGELILNIEPLSDSQLSLSFETLEGWLYQIEMSSDLNTSPMESIGDPIQGTGSVVTQNLTVEDGARYFRVSMRRSE